jgi:hypothetical protein
MAPLKPQAFFTRMRLMLRALTILSVVVLPLAAVAQAVMPGQPLGQPVGPHDSDILRRSQRSLPPDQPPPPPPGATQPVPGSSLGGLVQPDGRIVITRDLCNQVSVEHRPAPDVAYRGGTDVYGRAVAPADLPNSGASYGGLGSRSSTDILIAPQAGGLNQRGVVGETFIGRVTVDQSGRVAINGQPVDGPDQSELRQLCARAGY